jgi:glycosyltransferase involved in cell wall biosynthesis
MKVALVHDYIREYGGAERVLEALCEAFPDAPIYTAFVRYDGRAYERFKNRKIYQSWAAHIPFFAEKLHSPLRFLAPTIWNSFDFSSYDVVITSASWYITKGVLTPKVNTENKGPIEICYCHTPPRWLYGYKTSVEWQKYWPVKLYAAIVGHTMRIYDFKSAQRVDYFIANSKETVKRIEKFYRRTATIIYPPVDLPKIPKTEKQDYYFMVARLTGAKGLDIAVKAAIQAGFKLKIAGESGGYYNAHKDLMRIGKGHVEFLGHVSDEKLVELYAGAKGFLALATDEDFGITPVESMLCGTPVIAFNGGGYKETVVDGKTGILFDKSTPEGLIDAIKKFEKINIQPQDCVKQAEKFSKQRFIKEIKTFVASKVKR